MWDGENMKLDEDLGPDREDDFQTDDEENQAERVFDNMDDDDDDSESDSSTPPPQNSPNGIAISPSWPQSYRQSVDMLTSVTPPKLTLLKRFGSFGKTSFKSEESKRPEEWQDDPSLTKPLISETISIKEEEPKSVSPVQSQKNSFSELPPPQQQCSFSQAFVNAANILCGIGILAIPYAVQQGGWWSLTILLMYCIICCYTGILLKRCLECHSGLQTFPDIGQAAFGIAGRLSITIILFMELYASCVEFIILMSDNLASLFPNTHMRFAGTNLTTHQTFAITAAALVLPTVWLRNLNLLSYLSVGGIISTILVTACLLWVGWIDQVGVHPGGKLLDLSNLPVSVGLYGFCFAGHAVFPNIYSSMQEPSKFPLVLFASFAFCLVLYTGVAAVGYATFGDSVQSQFTLNMPKELYASKIATWTTVASPLAKYALTLLPIALSIEELIPNPRLRCHATSVFVRTVLLISCLAVALSVPYFGALMSLIGSFLSMLVALVYPCACYLKLHQGKLSKMQITNSVLIIIVGVVSAAVGTYSSIAKIINEGD